MAVKPPGPIDTDEEAAPAPEKEPESHGVLGFLKELPVLIVLAFVLALLIKTFLVQAFYIPSASMEPTLMPGDRVLVNKLSPHFGLPAHGDIIVFSNPHPTEEPQRNAIESFFHWVGEGLGLATPPNEDFIKRVIGLPGDRIQMKDGLLYINDTPVERQRMSEYVGEDPCGSEGGGISRVKRWKETLPGGVTHTIIEIQGDTGFNDNTPLFEVPREHYFMMGDNRDNS
ncbi:MAG: signal peptidase I, partial [Actinomycetota bacterium]